MRRLWLALSIGLTFALLACDSTSTDPEAVPEPAPPPVDAGDPGPTGAVSEPEPVSAPAPAAERVRIATWNLEWLHRQNGQGIVKRTDADYARLRGYASRLDADVVAFQEVDGVEAARRVFDDRIYEFHVADQSGVQLVGFAYKRGLTVTPNPDYAALSLDGSVREGADITVSVGETRLRLLSVHLKSGCFSDALSSGGNACTKLRQQVPLLEAWIDARASEGTPFAVLGDFNRRLNRPGDEVWSEIDDASPAAADLSKITEGQTSACWSGEFPEYIDHIVLDLQATPWLSGVSQQLYDASDLPFKSTLSDHCPLIAEMSIPTSGGVGGVGGPAPDPVVVPDPAPDPGATDVGAGSCLIKGNISSGGRKLYHRPGCPSYDQVEIDLDRGERCFQTDQEAVSAGWSLAGNCP